MQAGRAVAPLSSDRPSSDPGAAAGERRPTPRTRSRSLAVAFAVAGVWVALDQATKSWALAALEDGPIVVAGPVSFDLAYNRGAAFGLGAAFTPLLVAVAAILVVALARFASTATSKTSVLAAGLVLGGAVGNLVDRLARPFDGAVVDFIDVGWWPTFNVADIGITVGAALLALMAVLAPADEPEPAGEASGGDGQP